jgi:NADH-quinone oxidoreductase subunit G
MEVNKYWMCDEGMLSYSRAIEGRILEALVGGDESSIDEAVEAAKDLLTGHSQKADRVAIVLSAQHSLEDNFAMHTLAKTFLGSSELFVTGKPLGRGDDILMSEDKNPNTAGVMKLGGSTPPKPLADLVREIDRFDWVLALGSDVELEATEVAAAFKGKKVVVVASHKGPLASLARVVLPACSWAEVDATWVNRQGKAQASERALTARGSALPGWLLLAKLGRALGYAMPWKKLSEIRRAMAGEPVAAAATAGELEAGNPKSEART